MRLLLLLCIAAASAFVVAGGTRLWRWSGRPDAPDEVWALAKKEFYCDDQSPFVIAVKPDGERLDSDWRGIVKCGYDRSPTCVFWDWRLTAPRTFRDHLAALRKNQDDRLLHYWRTEEMVETRTGRWFQFVCANR